MQIDEQRQEHACDKEQNKISELLLQLHAVKMQ